MSEHIAGRSVSVSTYNNRGCRCDGCKAAHTRYMREYRRRLGGLTAHERARLMAADWVKEQRPDLWAGFLEQANEDIQNASAGES